jgi:hypothetical protein
MRWVSIPKRLSCLIADSNLSGFGIPYMWGVLEEEIRSPPNVALENLKGF